MKKPVKKRLTQQPWFAACLLAVGGYVAWSSLAGSGGALGAKTAAVADAVQQWLDPEVDADGQTTVEADSGPGRDLVAEFGVWRKSAELPALFAVAPEAAAPVPAPLAETRPAGAWSGDAPPFLTVGVVMVSEDSRRAVVAGRVVGVGDAIGEAIVVRIERAVVQLQWRDRRLTYELAEPVPVEYRAEHARRAPATATPSLETSR